jgi:hypothetical protein
MIGDQHSVALGNGTTRLRLFASNGFETSLSSPRYLPLSIELVPKLGYQFVCSFFSFSRSCGMDGWEKRGYNTCTIASNILLWKVLHTTCYSTSLLPQLSVSSCVSRAGRWIKADDFLFVHLLLSRNPSRAHMRIKA